MCECVYIRRFGMCFGRKAEAPALSLKIPRFGADFGRAQIPCLRLPHRAIGVQLIGASLSFAITKHHDERKQLSGAVSDSVLLVLLV